MSTDLGIGMKVETVAGEIKATGRLVAISPEVIRNQVLARVRFEGAQHGGTAPEPARERAAAHRRAAQRVDGPRGPFFEAHGGKYAYVMEEGFAVRKPIRVGATERERDRDRRRGEGGRPRGGRRLGGLRERAESEDQRMTRKGTEMLHMKDLTKVYRTHMIETHALRGFDIDVTTANS
jgi:hypothetical protein